MGDGDWLEGDEVRNLPPGERDDLELWLMEQAFRYCRALGDRRGSPADWLRAARVLDRIDATTPLEAVAILRRHLDSKLAGAGPVDSVPGGLTASPLPQAGSNRASRRPSGLDTPGSTNTSWAWPPSSRTRQVRAGAEAPRTQERSTCGFLAFGPSREVPRSADFQGTRRALGYYDRVLAWRPDSFWGHYRAPWPVSG